MIHLNYLAIAVAAIAVFVFAAVYYVVLSRQLAQLGSGAAANPAPMPLVMGLKLFTSLVVAAVIAGLVRLARITDVGGAVKLGLVLWIAFPVVLLAGSVVHEDVPWRLAAIHSGDWLAKLLIISVIVSVWR